MRLAKAHPDFGGVLQDVTQLEYSRIGVLRKYIHFILFNLDYSRHYPSWITPPVPDHPTGYVLEYSCSGLIWILSGWIWIFLHPISYSMRSAAFSMLDFQFQDNISRNTNAYTNNLFSWSSLFQTTCCHLSFRFHLLQRPCLNPPLQKSLRFEHGLENCKSLLGSPRFSYRDNPFRAFPDQSAHQRSIPNKRFCNKPKCHETASVIFVPRTNGYSPTTFNPILCKHIINSAMNSSILWAHVTSIILALLRQACTWVNPRFWRLGSGMVCFCRSNTTNPEFNFTSTSRIIGPISTSLWSTNVLFNALHRCCLYSERCIVGSEKAEKSSWQLFFRIRYLHVDVFQVQIVSCSNASPVGLKVSNSRVLDSVAFKSTLCPMFD